MFDDLMESGLVRRKTRQGWAIAFSAVLQLASLLVLVLIPLIYTQALPRATLISILVAPGPPPPPPPPEAPASAAARRRPPRFLQDNILHPPKFIPTHALILDETDLPADLAEGNWAPSTAASPSLLELIRDVGSDGPPAPPPPGPVIAPQRIRVGGHVQAARVISRLPPVYPPLARQTTIQGTVVLHAIIDVEGGVSELEVVSGHPLLARAALDAVRRWRYQPTLLNGEPVEVDTTITVNFILDR